MKETIEHGIDSKKGNERWRMSFIYNIQWHKTTAAVASVEIMGMHGTVITPKMHRYMFLIVYWMK